MSTPSAYAWADEEFGSAVLGNALRTRRAVQMAATAAMHPGGKITDVFVGSAAREGAFRFVENGAVPTDELRSAREGAAARRCADTEYVYAPIDKTSLSFTDKTSGKGLGMVGSSHKQGQGLCVMTVLVITPDGVPQGVASQQFWTRRRKRRTTNVTLRRTLLKDKETQRWLDAMDHATAVFATDASSCRPWFQIDREGDVTVLLQHAVTQGYSLTVRATYDRRVATPSGERGYLGAFLARQPRLGTYSVDVPASPTRQARRARLEVRATPVTLLVLRGATGVDRRPLTLGVVHAHEVGTTPRGETPLDWRLLTTHPVDDVGQALAVVRGYEHRWCIEEFHKAWKSGACRVEESQLRNRDHLERWALLLASVAVRLMRMARVARTQPELPATTEFTPTELQALVMLLHLPRPRRAPRLGEATTWLARLGGYSGKSSGGPPGFLVLGRGLARLQPAAEILTAMAQKR